MCPLFAISRMLASILLRISLNCIIISRISIVIVLPDVRVVPLTFLRQQDFIAGRRELGWLLGWAGQRSGAQSNETEPTWELIHVQRL